jgi:cytochrome c
MHCYGTNLNCHGVNFGISKHVRVSSQQNIVDNTPRRSRHRVAMRVFCCGMGSYMRTVLGSVMVGVAGLVLGGAASGQSTTGLALAQSSHCMSCHQVERKRVGPSFQVIAERFAGQDGAIPYLAETIRSGGRGRWGAVPMPAQPHVSPTDAQLLAAWIVSLADKPAIIKENP